MPTLWDALNALPDRRTKKGRRYPLASIVGISIAAVLCGADDLRAIFRWGRRLSPAALEAFGIARGCAPCHATYHYFFRDFAADALENALCAHLRGEASVGHVALDGKRLRGSRRGEAPGLHLLVAYCTDLKASLGSFAVAPDSGEAPEAIEFLKRLPLAGAVVTADAGFANRAVAAAIGEAGASYFLTVKGNQPELQAELSHAFGDDSPLGDRLGAGPPPGGARSARFAPGGDGRKKSRADRNA
jgi:hypothetical protein